MEEKEYQFTREATYIQCGIVTATSEEEAKQKVIDGDYDDIYDSYLDSEDNDTINIMEN